MTTDGSALSSVPPAFRELIAGKTVTGGGRKLGPGVGWHGDFDGGTVEAHFAAGRAAPPFAPAHIGGLDSWSFSDGSSYCDQGGKHRYRAAPGEQARCEALGLKEKNGYFFLET